MSALAAEREWVTALGEIVHPRGWTSEGSYARVYQGTRLQEPCAVKLAKPEVPGAAGLIRREGDLLARVRDPQVVRLLDRGEAPTGPFLVLEWLPGETLRDRLERTGRLPLRQALEVVADLARALAAFHPHAAHGDVRPENVLLPPGRGAVLIDPLVPDPPAAQPQADLRALGGALHRMLTGADPDPEPRLTLAAGYNRGAVALWERLRGGYLSAAELLAEAEALRRSL
jgi:serine/threonine protein kinase